MAVPFPIKTKVLPRNNLIFSGGTNINAVVDWEEPMFIDRAKQARGWLNEAVLDSRKRCASLSSGTTARFYFCSYGDNSSAYLDSSHNRGGRFQVKLISGSATNISVLLASNVTQINATTWEFDHDWSIAGDIQFFNASNFPLEVSIVRTDLLSAHAAGQIFDPNWLATIPTGATLRFLDAMKTNNSPYVNAADYPAQNWQHWEAMPFEVMVALCNLKSCDMWVCWPHMATDAFVADRATYIKNNLNSGLKLLSEYSNEIWNTGTFGGAGGQTLWLKGQAEAVWGVANGYGGPYWQEYAGKRFAQTMTAINTVFAGQTSRVLGVIAGQAAGTSVATNQALALSWQTYEPGSYIAPYTLARHISIAPYLNWGSGSLDPTTAGNAIKTQLDISQAAAVAQIKTLFAPSLAQSKGWIDQHVALAESYGCELTFYEYNQHYSLLACAGSNLYSGGQPVAGALTAFLTACYSTECAAAMNDLRTYAKRKGVTRMVFYMHMARASTYGQWGMQTNIGHTNPTRTQWDAWHAANPAWY